MLVVLYFVLIFCPIAIALFLYYKARKSFDMDVSVTRSDNTFDRKYFALKDEVSGEMLFSPFFAQNSACAIRQVQELVVNPQLFPKSLKPEDVGLYYCFTINGKSLVITDGYDADTIKVLKICACDEDSLKKAYQLHKEVK